YTPNNVRLVVVFYHHDHDKCSYIDLASGYRRDHLAGGHRHGPVARLGCRYKRWFRFPYTARWIKRHCPAGVGYQVDLASAPKPAKVSAISATETSKSFFISPPADRSSSCVEPA